MSAAPPSCGSAPKVRAGPRRLADSIPPRIACCSTAAAGTRSRNCARPRASASQRPAARGVAGRTRPAAQAPGRGRNPIPAADFTTAERLDRLVPPQVTGTDPFFEFLFSRAPVKYSELKRRAEAREALPAFRLDGVTLTFDVNTDYEVVRTQLTQNVVGDRRGLGPAAEADLRGVRRPLRSRRLRGRRAHEHGRWAAPRGVAGPHHHGLGSRPHLERGGRRRFGNGHAAGHGARLRAGAAAEAVGPVRLARGRGARPLGVDLFRRPRHGRHRPHRRAAEHRHGGPQPRQQGQRIEHAVHGRVRPHQHRARPDRAGRQPRRSEPAPARLRIQRSRRIPSSSTRAAITTATRRAASRSSSSRPAFIRTTTPTPTTCRRSSSTRCRASANSSTRPVCASQTSTTRRSGTGREHAWVP